MRTIYVYTLASVILSACSLPTRTPATEYKAEQFVGWWTVADGTYKGREYEAKIDGDELVMVAVTDTDCLPAGSIVFTGNTVGNKMVGSANFCIGTAPVSTGRMIVSIKDTSTLIGMVEGYADINFPSMDLERVIRLSRHRED